jgi:hypothetical protein
MAEEKMLDGISSGAHTSKTAKCGATDSEAFFRQLNCSTEAKNGFIGPPGHSSERRCRSLAPQKKERGPRDDKIRAVEVTSHFVLVIGRENHSTKSAVVPTLRKPRSAGQPICGSS